MKIEELLIELLKVSEKAADLARIIRSEESLFALLVEEKTGTEQNKRFIRDFKTLADVLVQETVRHDLGAKFSRLKDKIYGEESQHFTNTLGETIDIVVQAAETDTANLLSIVLDGNKTAATLLAKVVHEKVVLAVDARPSTGHQELGGDICTEDVAEDSLGIWIDPIDATAQYIKGGSDQVSPSGIHNEGLRCVVVLIGVYDLYTGLPVAGVINQPFVTYDPQTARWTGRRVWGVAEGLHRSSSCYIPPPDGRPDDPAVQTAVVISSSESDTIQSRLKSSGRYELVYAAGAGYKLLNIIDRLACCYLLTKGSTYKWDSCAPHAVLLALGGGIVDYLKALNMVKCNMDKPVEDLADMMKNCQLLYNHENCQWGLNEGGNTKDGGGDEGEGIERWCNTNGLVAYRDVNVLIDILKSML